MAILICSDTGEIVKIIAVPLNWQNKDVFSIGVLLEYWLKASAVKGKDGWGKNEHFFPSFYQWDFYYVLP